MNINFGIITISDRSFRGERPDLAGPALQDLIISQGWNPLQLEVIPDEKDQIKNLLKSWADSGEFEIILTTGGTGFSPRDVTPEATQSVIERSAPGISEAMRAIGYQVTPHAMLSRAIAGIRRKTLIINLPGNPKAAVENFNVIVPVIPHAVQLLSDGPEAESSHNLRH